MNGTGLYTFTNLISGTYYASFTIPSGYSFTVPNVGNPATDSNAIPVGGNPRVGTTPPLVIPAGLITNTVDAAMQEPARTLDVLEQVLGEIDAVVAALRDVPGIDAGRLAIGGMSLGGMVTLRRLCDRHGFLAASVEGTCGWLEGMYFPAEHGLAVKPWPVDHPRERVRRLDPRGHLAGWAPIPMLVLHSEADEMVPWEVQRRFVEELRGRYAEGGPELVVKTWATTGAPREHIGFGKFSNDAKNLQTEFFARALGAVQG